MKDKNTPINTSDKLEATTLFIFSEIALIKTYLKMYTKTRIEL